MMRLFTVTLIGAFLLSACGSGSINPALATLTAATPSVPSISRNTTFYVDRNNGSDSYPGSKAKPWQSIQKCLNKVQPGDTCEIRGGTYNEALVFKNSGTNTARITIRNSNNEIVTIDSGNEKTLVTTGRIHFYTIEGLRFIADYPSTGQGDATIDLSANIWDGETTKDGGNNGFIFKDCYIEGAILFYGHDNLVENCELNGKGNWTNGLYDRFASSYDNTYRGNKIYDYTIRGIWTMQGTENITIEKNTVFDIGEIGIDCDGAWIPVNHCIVRNNKVYNVTGEGVGILLENAFDAVVEGNTIYNIVLGISTINYGINNPDSSYYVSSAEYREKNTNTVIRNNIIYFAGSDGILCKASPGGKALNNTIYETKQLNGYWAAIGLARYGNYYCHSWEIKNNIISQPEKYAIWYEGPHDGLDNLSVDYNLFDFNSSEPKFFWVEHTEESDTWYEYTLTQIQDQMQLERHSIIGNPLFVDANNSNFQLQANSPAIDIGFNLGNLNPYDINGSVRPQGAGYEIGAYEYSSDSLE